MDLRENTPFRVGLKRVGVHKWQKKLKIVHYLQI